MTGVAYYNENDPAAAAWLCELIKAGLIAPGVVDTRSTEDVRPAELTGFTQCHFFAGIGGWSYALRLAGWPDDKPVWTGSCPCQPFGTAGKGAGFADERHLWPTFFHLISQSRPSIVFGEQVAGRAGCEWLDTVQIDLENVGYTVGAASLCAASVGAPHVRQRLYWVANTNNAGPQRHGRPLDVNATQGRQDAPGHSAAFSLWGDVEWVRCADGKQRPIKPGIELLVNGLPGRVAALRGFGNAIVPQVAAQFILASGA